MTVYKTKQLNQNNRLNQKNMAQTLDDILFYLKSTIFIESQDYIQYINAIDIFFFCYGEEFTKIHNYTEPRLFLEKLCRDGFVNYNENEYQINLQGIEFINNGGYRKRIQSKKRNEWWEKIKIVSVLLNAVVLLIFAYYSFKRDQIEIKKESQVKVETIDF